MPNSAWGLRRTPHCHMRILDRYTARQLLPIWIWCLVIAVFMSCLIDLFEHLDDIIRYHIPRETIVRYYLNFTPFVLVHASPLALLFSAAFVAMRLSRHQEFLAMNASGTSLLRATVPFLFVGWLVSLAVFVVSDHVVPRTSVVYERLRQEAFRSRNANARSDVAMMDSFNRLYHARKLNLEAGELNDLTVLEHDQQNRPTKTLYASRAVWTQHGWLLLHGTIYRVGPRGVLQGEPEPFVERLITYPITLESFRQPEARPETMRYSQLRLLVTRLRQIGLTNVRRYEAELASKLAFPLMNLVMCLIAFTASTRLHLRGHLRGLGMSLGWGMLYYLGVSTAVGMAKERPLPVVLTTWTPHLAAIVWCWRTLKQ